jgi:hypothetical protein
MSAQAIARAVGMASRYRKRDGSSIGPEQFHARVSNLPERLERTPAGIQLRDASSHGPAASITQAARGRRGASSSRITRSGASRKSSDAYSRATSVRLKYSSDVSRRDLTATLGVQRPCCAGSD